MSDDHYDVIVIGSGAGGGTLAHRLAPAGKRVLLLERGGYLPARARQLGARHAVFVRGKYLPPESWYDRHHNAVPARGQLLRRRQHEVLRRGAVPAASRGLRRAEAPRRDLAGLADRLRGPRALLHAGRAPLPGARRHGEDPFEGPYSARLRRTRRWSTSRASSSCRDDLEKLGLHPFHLPIGVNLDQDADGPREPRAASASAATASTASRAWSRRSPTRRSSASTRRVGERRRRAAHRRLRASGSRPTPPVAASPVSSSGWTDGGAGHLQRGHRGRRLRRGELGGAAAALRRTTAPGRTGQRLGRRRPPLHAAQQPRPDGASPRSPTPPASRRRWR